MGAAGRARFIAFEGDDGTGKTTQVARLAARLEALGRRVVTTREPGGTPLGERVRALLLDADAPLEPAAEALLFAAARAQLVAEVIAPALARGETVLCDRFVDSSVVYQGVVRGLGAEVVAELNRFATGGCDPDLVMLLDLDPAVAAARAGSPGDRFEGAGLGFHVEVADGFRSLAAASPERYVLVDALGSPDEVAERVWSAVAGHGGA